MAKTIQVTPDIAAIYIKPKLNIIVNDKPFKSATRKIIRLLKLIIKQSEQL